MSSSSFRSVEWPREGHLVHGVHHRRSGCPHLIAISEGAQLVKTAPALWAGTLRLSPAFLALSRRDELLPGREEGGQGRP